MSRSVAVHRHAVTSAYIAIQDDEYFSFDDFIDEIRGIFTGDAGVEITVAGQEITIFPGYSHEKRHNIDREVITILSGALSEISISIYNGIASVSLSPLDPGDAHHIFACQNASEAFRAFLKKAYPQTYATLWGVMSNGESVYTYEK